MSRIGEIASKDFRRGSGEGRVEPHAERGSA
jgi:hypothetical protein